MWIGLFGWAATVISVIGVILNNRKIRLSFVLWMFSNALSLAIHWQTGIWSLTIRDTVFILLAVEGWRLWKKTDEFRHHN